MASQRSSKRRNETQNSLADSSRPKNYRPEEDAPCLACKNNVREGIACDGCDRWCHQDCSGLSKNVFSAIVSKPSDCLLWVCRECKEPMCILLKGVEQLKVMHDKLAALEDRLANLENIESGHQETTYDINYNEIAEEVRFRTIKKNNLVVFGLPDTGEDKKNLESLMAEGLSIDASTVTITATRRLGREQAASLGQHPRPRPLLVRLDNASDKAAFFGNLRNLRASTFNRVRIENDLTEIERKYKQEIVKELKERQLKGEQNIRLAYKNGTPFIKTY